MSSRSEVAIKEASAPGDPVRSLICITRATLLDPALPNSCVACGALTLDDEWGSLYPHPLFPSFASRGDVALCDFCRAHCHEVCASAVVLMQSSQGLIESARSKAQMVPSPRLVARRIALLRALPSVLLCAVESTAHKWCAWCGDNTGHESSRGLDEPVVIRVVHAGCGMSAALANWARHAFWLHVGCRDMMNAAICATWVDRCVPSLVFMIRPLGEAIDVLPEVVRHIASFICQLSAVGIEAATAASGHALVA